MKFVFGIVVCSCCPNCLSYFRKTSCLFDTVFFFFNEIKYEYDMKLLHCNGCRYLIRGIFRKRVISLKLNHVRDEKFVLK